MLLSDCRLDLIILPVTKSTQHGQQQQFLHDPTKPSAMDTSTASSSSVVDSAVAALASEEKKESGTSKRKFDCVQSNDVSSSTRATEQNARTTAQPHVSVGLTEPVLSDEEAIDLAMSQLNETAWTCSPDHGTNHQPHTQTRTATLN